MNWLTNLVRPKIKALVGAADDGETRWAKCPACGQMIYRKELIEARHVCPNCNHHMRLPAKERLNLLFDDGVYEKATLGRAAVDPLKFRDIRRYTERLKESQTRTGESDAILVASGTIAGVPAVIAVFDFAFMGGSMGMAVGDGLLTAARLAVAKKCPLITVPASGGARMQEGILSLMQLPRTVIAVQMVKEAGLPYIVLLTDPTTGGVSASFAMLGDIAIAEPGAVIGFAGSRVIEETIRETLPDGFQRAEYLRDHGMVDMVIKRSELRETLGRVLGMMMQPAKEKFARSTSLVPAGS